MTEQEDPSGPLASGVEAGVPWCVYPGGLGWMVTPNGYAHLPEGHPWRKLPREDIPLHHVPEVTAMWDGWIGFDTGHSSDVWDPKELESLGLTVPEPPKEVAAIMKRRVENPQVYQHKWTADEIVEVTREMARQVAEAMTPSEPKRAGVADWG